MHFLSKTWRREKKHKRNRKKSERKQHELVRVFQVVLWDPRVETNASSKWRRRRRRENALQKTGGFSILGKFQFSKKRERFRIWDKLSSKIKQKLKFASFRMIRGVDSRKNVQSKTRDNEVAQNQTKLEGYKITKKPRKWTDVNTSAMDILVYLSYFSFSI